MPEKEFDRYFASPELADQSLQGSFVVVYPATGFNPSSTNSHVLCQ